MPILRAPSKKPIVLAAIHPNAGLQMAYQKRIDALVDEMQASLVYWLKAAYRANEPEMAQDASPATALRDAMRKLSRRWQKRFDEAAPDLARYFATNAADRSDSALRATLKRCGFAVEFKMTAAANDVMQATIGENVGLIRSIASQHLSDVEGMVMRSVSAGRDLGTLSQELAARYGVTKRRAAFIARDQNNKATANITRVRQDGLGITEAQWIHSHGGAHPRPSHVAAAKKRYAIKEGMYLDGKWTWPGVEPGCRCISRSVIPGLDD
ncbi:MAG: putative phage head morphosis protein [Herbaspirillum sp.]|nr:putative phage head morphosis protein [Herbaspirillum sp.]